MFGAIDLVLSSQGETPSCLTPLWLQGSCYSQYPFPPAYMDPCPLESPLALSCSCSHTLPPKDLESRSMAETAVRVHPVSFIFSDRKMMNVKISPLEICSLNGLPQIIHCLLPNYLQNLIHPKIGPYTPRPTKPSLLKILLDFISLCDLTSDFAAHQTRKSIS